jgi:hypothetical protein
MTFTFKPALRENVPLLIGLAGGTGSGKTFTAMRLATGLAAGKRFAVIDTEAGRAKHYADRFQFDHGDLRPPFTPSAYKQAIEAADEAGYPVIVVDSASHEHAGEGGLLDWHESELQRMAGDNWQRREAVKVAAWIKPKADHKKFVSRLLQLRAHLILCFRAEEKIEIGKDENGKTVVRKKQSLIGLDGWLPICEKNLPYELTASFLLMAQKPGVPLPIKLQEQHREFFPLDKPITEDSGRRLAEWAKGGAERNLPLQPDNGSGARREAAPVTETPVHGAAGGEKSGPGALPHPSAPHDAAVSHGAARTLDWDAAIQAAASREELDRVGKDLVKAGANMFPPDLDRIRGKYKARLQAFDQASAP